MQGVNLQQIAAKLFGQQPQNPLYPPPDPSQGAPSPQSQPAAAPPQPSPNPTQDALFGNSGASTPPSPSAGSPRGTIASAMQGQTPAPSLDDYVQQHGHAPIEAPPPAPPEHGMLYKVMNGIGRFMGNPMAEQAANRDWNLKQQNIAYGRNQPVMQHQADQEALDRSLGQSKTAAQTREENVHADVEAQNLPAGEQAAKVHDELTQRWQGNTDPDENSFMQFAQQRLSAEPPSVQRRLMGDPAHGFPSPLQGITKLPRQPFSFKIADGAIQPGTYRGANYGPEAASNEPPEVTAARNNAMSSITQGQKGKIAVATAEAKAKNAINLGNFGQPGDPMIDMVGQGRVDLQSVLQRIPPQGKEAFMASLNAKYPGFNQSTYGISKNVGEAFTAGSQGQQLTAINTAREHMKVFSQLAGALDNGNVQVLNQLGNVLGVQFGNDKATNFKIAAQAFGGEVGKAFDGAGVTEGERKSAQGAFNPNMSPEQFRGAIKTVDALLAGKQKSLQSSYEQGRQGQPNFGQPQAGGGEGPTATGPNGHKIKVVNGKWVDAATGQPIQ